MTKLNFIHLCDSAFITEGSKNLNIIGIFDVINSEGFPAIQPRMTIVTGVSSDTEGRHTLETVIRHKNKPLYTQTKEFSELQYQNIHNLFNLPLLESGEYYIDVLVDKMLVGTKSFLVNKI
ncbi:MAG: DUF6941 family protein [Candidatus Doudnabacteria bacterium]